MNKTALSLLLCDALGKLKRRTRVSRRTVWEPRTLQQSSSLKWFNNGCCSVSQPHLEYRVRTTKYNILYNCTRRRIYLTIGGRPKPETLLFIGAVAVNALAQGALRRVSSVDRRPNLPIGR